MNQKRFSQPFEFSKKAKKILDFPEQKVFLKKENGKEKCFVQLEDNDEIEIPFSVGRFIKFALSLRDREVQTGFKKIKSPILRRLIIFSNCHRTMLVALGFSFKEVLENDSGSAIIDRFFKGDKEIQLQQLNISQVEQEILKYKKKNFPICVNFFVPSKINPGDFEAIHSTLVLGISKKGRIICFQKDGIGDNEQVCLTELTKIYEMENVQREIFATVVSTKKLKSIYNQIRRFAISRGEVQ